MTRTDPKHCDLDCRAFESRMNDLMDHRQSLEQDLILQEHLRSCGRCTERMQSWAAIESVIDGSDNRPSIESTADDSKVRSRFSPYRFAIATSLVFVLAGFAWMNRDQPADVIAQNVIADKVDADADAEHGPMSHGRDDQTASLPLTNPSSETDRIDPAIWWQDFSNRDWLAEAMPAVESMGESVAPIGRSLRRAFSRIAIGSAQQTS